MHQISNPKNKNRTKPYKFPDIKFRIRSSSSSSSVVAESVHTELLLPALVVARAAVALVEGEGHALPSAARFREDALLLTRAAVLVVVLQVHALVVAARGVAGAAVEGQVAHVVVLVAVVGGPRVPLLVLEEPAHAGGGKNRSRRR